MPYTITRADGQTQDIADGAVDDTKYSIGVVGRNTLNYGETVANTQVNELENFAADTAPLLPIPGQLWYDKANKVLNFNTGDGDNATSDWTALVASDGNSIGDESDPIPQIYADQIGSATSPVDQMYVTQIGDPSNPVSDIYGGTFHGTATTAQYADLAERFKSDKPYEPGTVVKLGGKAEITTTNEHMDLNVFGVVSEAPAFMMNAKAGNDQKWPFVAFAGRVEVYVQGPIKKGQRIVAGPGRGTAIAVADKNLIKTNPLAIIGRALKSKTSEGVDKVLVVVGAK